MLTTGMWIVLAFAIGAYAGITLMAMMKIASREAPLPDGLSVTEGPRSMAVAAATAPVDAAVRPKRERRSVNSAGSRRREPEILEQQAQFHW